MSNARTILVKGDGLFKEALAGGTILPGHLIQQGSTGTVVVHATDSGHARKMFAVENDMEGNGIDVAYTSGDRVYYVVPQSGAEINALVAAGSAAIVIGDPLTSDGDGTLKKWAAGDDEDSGVIIAYAREAVNNSGGAEVARILVEVV